GSITMGMVMTMLSTRVIFMWPPASASALEAERAPGLRGEALERRRIHVRPGPEDQAPHAERGVGVPRGLVRNVVTRRRHADLERTELGGTLVLLRHLADVGGEVLRRRPLRAE